MTKMAELAIRNKNSIKIISDLFSEEQCHKIWELPKVEKWYYGNLSNAEVNSIPFWKIKLDDDSFYSEELFETIKDKVDKSNLELKRVYANGHLFGTQGQVHQDHTENGHYTFLYYGNPEWYNEWGGSTIWILDNDGNHYNYYPKPNTGVFFPSKLYHYAEPTTRLFYGLRVTIAWKLKVT